MSSTDSIEGMQESRAQAPEGVGPMATAMAAHRGATRSSFHLHLQGDRLGTIWGRVAAERSARQSVRIARPRVTWSRCWFTLGATSRPFWRRGPDRSGRRAGGRPGGARIPLVEDRTERLIPQNRLLLAQLATARATSRKTIACAMENIAILRQSQIP